ncbi:MAG: DUF2147 domain-containing protein [Pseudomonadales bacterium]|nr:DUF2147 domain-containing protein [Pseudomonadales bacterium]
MCSFLQCFFPGLGEVSASANTRAKGVNWAKWLMVGGLSAVLSAQAQPYPQPQLNAPEVINDADRVLGQWVMPDGSALIEIYPQGSSYSVRIVKLRDPRFTVADSVDDKLLHQPRIDIHSPDSKLESQSLTGLVIASGLKYQDGIWAGGKIYDPNSGNYYRCKLEWVDGNYLRVRGYMGISLFGETMYWQRATVFKTRTLRMLEGLLNETQGRAGF